jgi:FkbM family methyltransferase
MFIPNWLRKFSATLRLVTTGDWTSVSAAAGKNWRRARLRLRGGRPLVYRTPSGTRFVCLPQSATSVHLFVDRVTDQELESHVCRSWLKEGDACIDLGANIGAMSVMFAERVGPSGRVIAVEPGPRTAQLLRQAADCLAASMVQVHEVCVSDAVGSVEFMTADDGANDEWASMRLPETRAAGFTPRRVPSVTVDRLLEGCLAKAPSLVKIDIEGAEPLALAGARRLFDPAHLPLFLVEVQKAALAAFGFEPLSILRYFSPEKFELFHVQRSRSDVTPPIEYGALHRLPNPAEHQWPWLANVIAVPREGAFAARRSQIAHLLPR